jgi:hypothetical protein
MRRRCCDEMSHLNAGGVVKVCAEKRRLSDESHASVASSWGIADDE